MVRKPVMSADHEHADVSGDGSANGDAVASGELGQISLKKAMARLRDRAYGYLMRREHSARELRDKLARFDEFDQRDQLIEQLIADNAQSDRRYAEHLARVRAGAGKGPVVLKQELQKHHIADDIVEEAMAEYDGQWVSLAEQARVRKFGEAMPIDYKEWARQARFLQQRGFTVEHIRRAG